MLFFSKKPSPILETLADASAFTEELVPSTVPEPSVPPAATEVPAASAPVFVSGFAPASRHLRHKVRRLSRHLKSVERGVGRARLAPTQFYPVMMAAPAPVPEAPPEELDALAEEVQPASAPPLDEAAIKGLVATAPIVVELQYEVLDLRHEVEALKQELAALRSQAAEVKTAKLSIVDAAGRVVAGISGDGTVSCRLIEMRAQ